MSLSEQVPFSAAHSAWRQQSPWQGAAGITKTGGPQLWLGFLPAGISLHCSSCPCDLQPHPPDGQSPWVPGAQWDWATFRLSLRPGSGSDICTSRVRPHPQVPFAHSLLVLLLCRETQKFIKQAKSPSTPPPCSQQQRCVVTETISKGFNQSGCQSTSCERILCNGKAF